ncbi:hypothetical protein CPC08DRAFT_712671 [Agrocybe pediades]|nr:hypothetical protein CPC08DRAFT_712671 [Agrocybe pediades]
MSIILYDSPTTVPDKALSPNMWKARFCLNYKGLAHKTEWVDYCDIQEHSKKLNIKPTGKNPDGSDFHSFPAIYDPKTGVYLADSFQIAVYLDKTYPDTPAIFPNNTIGLQAAFEGIFMASIGPFLGFTLYDTWAVQLPVSHDYVRKKFEGIFGGMPLEEIAPKGDRAIEEWKKLEEAFGKVEGLFKATDEVGPFVLGDRVSWGDIVVASFLIYFKRLWGGTEKDEQWRNISTWQGGRWAALLDKLDAYTAIH